MERIYDKETVDLARGVFNSYTESNNLKDYTRKINEISKWSGKSSTYLRQLREEYCKHLSKDEKKLYKQAKLRMNSSKIEHIDFVENVLSCDDSEKIAFISKSGYGLSEIKKYFNNYVEKNVWCREMLDDILLSYEKYVKDVKEAEAHAIRTARINEAKQFFDNMLSLGYYRILDYVNFCISNGSYVSLYEFNNKKMLYSKAMTYSNVLKQAGLKPLYKEKFMEVCKKRYQDNLFSIYFIKENLNNPDFDIIDFYLISEMGIGEFRYLCSVFWDDINMSFLNEFCSNNKEFELSEETIINSDLSINSVSLSDIDKEKILEFLNNYNIPVCYFDVASKKYLKGELDDYIGRNKIKKSNDLN